MAVLFSDTFTASHWDDINEYPARASLWTYRTNYSGSSTRWYIVNNRVHCAAPGAVTASVVPPSADYAVEADMILRTNEPSQNSGLMIRYSGDEYYTAYYQSGQLTLAKKVGGVTTVLDTWTSWLTYAGMSYRLRLEANGTTIGASIDGVLRCEAIDASIGWTGYAGLRQTGWGDANIGLNFDNFQVRDDTTLISQGPRTIGFFGL